MATLSDHLSLLTYRRVATYLGRTGVLLLRPGGLGGVQAEMVRQRVLLHLLPERRADPTLHPDFRPKHDQGTPDKDEGATDGSAACRRRPVETTEEDHR
ncbi:MAG: hypothetical protein HZB55_20090 [Deltaproteobacteria bacterium]|nr:hypothetical protein [Deltaproteobacteria bacterium]